MRVGMIHQPHFLPWPGYMARCLAAHTVVLLGGVKFNRGHFQHRTKYFDQTGTECWLTLPIAHQTRALSISEVEIAQAFRFLPWQRRFRSAYGRYPLFRPIWADIGDLIQQQTPSLVAVTSGTLGYLLDKVASVAGRTMPLVVTGPPGDKTSDRTVRLVKICAEQRLTHLIMGRDAVECHDCDLLRRSGLTLMQHRYRGPTERAPRPGITVLDDVCRLGWSHAVQRLADDWILERLDAAGGLE